MAKEKELTEYTGLEGHVNSDFYPDVGMDGKRICQKKIAGIYKPARFIKYKGNEVTYTVVEIEDKNEGFIIVPGYKRSEPYEKFVPMDIDFGDKLGDERAVYSPMHKTTIKIEKISSEKEKEDIRKLIKEKTGLDWHANFW